MRFTTIGRLFSTLAASLLFVAASYGDSITFNTIWHSASASCNSITAWTGFLYQGKISSLWSLTINGSSNTSQIIRGNDTFIQVKKLVDKSLILRK